MKNDYIYAMAYDKNKIFEKSKALIVKRNLFFIEDIVALLPIRKSTFYDYFPIDSDELNTIKELLETNKTNTKVAIRGKLMAGEKAAELIALYKLICSEDERRSLSMQEFKHTGLPEQININVTSNEAADKVKEFIKDEPE